jgi:dihydropteroate synthase
MIDADEWLVTSHRLRLDQQGLVMGIVNVTPDSFSDGGQFFQADAAIQQGLKLEAEGAAILDVGGESTRPGAEPVSEEEELRRVVPVIAGLSAQSRALISIDTFKPRVAAAAVAAGAHIINDVSGFRDPDMIRVAANCSAGLVIMHMQGQPRTMQIHPEYEDVVTAVRGFLSDRIAALSAAGVDPLRLVLDPGIGFGKSLEHNLSLLRSLAQLRKETSRPILLGVSRKSMIGKVLGSSSMEDRHWPTVALTAWARESGANIFRVHQVRANVDALRMIEAIG